MPARLIGLLALAAALRLGTLDLQSLWYDEAFTPVHVLHAGLRATLRTMAHTENNPPLFYVVEWAWTRVFGTGAVALRMPSALAGVATVAVAWRVGELLAGRRGATIAAALFVVNPMFWWYSQEARSYSFLGLMGGMSLLFFLRACAEPASRRELWGWGAASVLALCSHYFAVFLVAPEAVLLLLGAGAVGRARVVAVAAVGAAGLALAPLALSQGGHGAQWIGRWALSSRLVAIPQYWLLGANSAPLGHALLIVAALPVLAAVVLAVRGFVVSAALPPGIARTAIVGGCGVLAPLVLAVAGADYLAPRNLIGAWVVLSCALAGVLASVPQRALGTYLAVLMLVSGGGTVVAVELSPRLQRGDWRGLAAGLRDAREPRAIVTAQLGSAPLEYYLHGLARARAAQPLRVVEIALVGYRPLVRGAARPPAAGFSFAGRLDVHGLIAFRFRARAPTAVDGQSLLARRITRARAQVLSANQPPTAK